jgi:formylglycine-generating enzyme required for sulfatase activity
VRASLPSLGRRLPELTEDLAELSKLLERGDDLAASLAKTRQIVRKAVKALCDEQRVTLPRAEASLDEMLQSLTVKNVVPASIATQIRRVSTNSGEPASEFLVDDDVRAMVALLEWRVGSTANRGSVSSIPPPIAAAAPIPSRRRLVIAISLAILVVAGIATAIALSREPTRDDVAREPPKQSTSEMAHISGATFEMGSREDELGGAFKICREVEHRDADTCKRERKLLDREQLRKVTISSFDLDRDEVNVGDFVDWLNTLPPTTDTVIAQPGVNYAPDAHRFSVQPGHATMPIVGLTWVTARAYCAALGKRLPTEAEWELAARGAARRLYPWGDAMPTCNHVVFARREGRQCDTAGPQDATPVGSASRDLTPEGVHDLAGNVSEWTEDAALDRPTCTGPCVDPRIQGGPSDKRVVRGGNWGSWVGELRGAARTDADPATPTTDTGFRCAR